MIRIAAVCIALLYLASESQAQFLPNFQPFGGRFRPCQPVFPIFPRCQQPQVYYYQTCPQPYFTVPNQSYVVPYTPVTPTGPNILPAPKKNEFDVPPVVVTPAVKPVVPSTVAQPDKTTNTPKKSEDGPRILPPTKRN
jgi:hypothetical protein